MHVFPYSLTSIISKPNKRLQQQAHHFGLGCYIIPVLRAPRNMNPNFPWFMALALQSKFGCCVNPRNKLPFLSNGFSPF